MNYISVAEAAKPWGLSERSVRNYCAQGRIPGALLTGKTWNVPENAEKPARKTRSVAGRKDLLTVLREEKATKLHGGIYHKNVLSMNLITLLVFILQSPAAEHLSARKP